MINKAERVFLVPHPVRKVYNVDINRLGKECHIYADPIGGDNEDPFIWNNQFMYSFCHAFNRLDKSLPGDVFVFMAKDDADIWSEQTQLRVDTILVVAETNGIIKWPIGKERCFSNIQKKFNKIANKSTLLKHIPNICEKNGEWHLIGKNKNYVHDWKYITTLVGDFQRSYLPLEKDCTPVTLDEIDTNLVVSLLKSNKEEREQCSDVLQLWNLGKDKSWTYLTLIEKQKQLYIWKKVMDVINRISNKTEYKIFGCDLLNKDEEFRLKSKR